MSELVREGLFIGSLEDAARVLESGSSGITHILSLLNSASISYFLNWDPKLSIPVREIRKAYIDQDNKDAVDGDDLELMYSLEFAGKDFKVTRMGVPIRDMETQNLLDYLEACLDFIHRSRQQGSVLVHCSAGISRSAAVVTAYLMRFEQLSCQDALESLKHSSANVCPNDGFLVQLKMFEEMGFKVDHTSPIYKCFHLKELGEAYNRGEKIDCSKFGADPALPKQVVSPAIEASSVCNMCSTPTYRCKKCRRLVAMQENVVEHTPGEGETSFRWHKRKGGNPSNKLDEVECSSVFVQPMRWMKTVEEGLVEGKLACVHCDARLGYFNWSGVQCSCGSWITPAFQLHKSRVDISRI